MWICLLPIFYITFPLGYNNERNPGQILSVEKIKVSSLFPPQVLWLGKERCDVTWEPAENVPSAIIEEFERNAMSTVKESIELTGVGQKIHTLTFDVNNSHTSTLQQSRTVVKESDGLVKYISVAMYADVVCLPLHLFQRAAVQHSLELFRTVYSTCHFITPVCAASI